MDEMAVGARGELFWTRHDAHRSVLLRAQLVRAGTSRTEVVVGYDPVRLWAGADGLPFVIDASGDLFRQDRSTGDLTRRAVAPCEHARALLGHGDHAYFTCPDEPGVIHLWMGERYTRLRCPGDVCGAPIVSGRVVGTGFPLSMSAPGRTALLLELADGRFALRRRGRWRRVDAAEASVARLGADATSANRRRVDESGRVWALDNGQLVFDGPDSYSGGCGIITDQALPALARFTMTSDARVIWAADHAGRLFRLQR